MAADIAIGALGGGLVAMLAGFVAAVVQLQAKRVRNARLIRAGEPAIRDCVLVPWHKMCPVVGAPAGAALAAVVSLPAAIAIAGLAAPGAIVLLSLTIALR